MATEQTKYSNYIVCVDESGNSTRGTQNKDYPVFVLAFCIFEIDTYTNKTVPEVQKLKFTHFGHDMIVLHEREIRKALPPFELLINQETRNNFLTHLTEIIKNADFRIVAVAIHENPNRNADPYRIAFEYGLERVFFYLQEQGARSKKTHIVFESRGKNEDRRLELEYRRILDTTSINGMAESLEILFASKQTNSTGLQLADMIARPIGLHVLKPNQVNRAWENIKSKLRVDKNGNYIGRGLKIVE